MKRFKQSLYNQNLAPIGGWNGFKHPITKYEFKGEYKSVDDIIYHVKTYEEQNDLKHVVNIRSFIENYFCERDGMGEFCEPCQMIRRNLSQTVKGASAFIKAKAKKFVGEEWHAKRSRAEARAEKCSKCSYNIPAGAQMGDAEMENLYSKEDGFHTPFDSRLIKCKGCGGCPLQPKVWFAPDIISDSLKGQTFYNINKLIVTNEEDKSERTQHVCWMMEEKFKSSVLDLHNQGLTPEVISDKLESISLQIIKYWIQENGNRGKV